jgi:DNA-directed RNA polymerase specialized sigma24 family protein
MSGQLDNDPVTIEAHGAVDAALAQLDSIDAGLVTHVDIQGAPFSRTVLELDLPSSEARQRLARARFRSPRRDRRAPPELTPAPWPPGAMASADDQSR